MRRKALKGGKAILAAMNDDEHCGEGPEYQRGYDFEKFVKGMFDSPDFKVLFWSEGKRTKVPDFYVQYGEKEYKFWVEARFRQEPFDKKVKIFGDRPDRLNLLTTFQGLVLPERVFIVLGLGGESKSPEKIFRIPILEVPYADLFTDRLEKHECGRSFTKYEKFILI
jgi:hypothetical protein